MCEFVSWVEKGEKVLFLTDALLDTPKGQLTLKEQSDGEDIRGHSAIRFYFGFERDEGKNMECTDFSSPDNFPTAVAKAIKNCEFTKIGTLPDFMFTTNGLTKVESNLAWREADKVWTEAYKVWEEAYKARDKAYKARDEAYEEAYKVWTEADKARDKAYKARDEADKTVKWKVFASPENRIEAWR
jgi:hypothetical protein